MSKEETLQFFSHGNGAVPYSSDGWHSQPWSDGWHNQSWYSPIQVAPTSFLNKVKGKEQSKAPESKDVVELKVHFCCLEGCESKFRDALEKVDGVGGVDCDYHRGKITVRGSAKEDKILRAVRSVDSRAAILKKGKN